MPLIPIFAQNELDSGDTDLADRLSAFNFCDPFDHVLPFTDGSIGALDRQHLWGMYAGIPAGELIVIVNTVEADTGFTVSLPSDVNFTNERLVEGLYSANNAKDVLF